MLTVAPADQQNVSLLSNIRLLRLSLSEKTLPPPVTVSHLSQWKLMMRKIFVEICYLWWHYQGRTILECKNILTAVMEPWMERSQYKLLSGRPRDEIFLSPYVLSLVVLTMKTNEAVGYQGCPIHLGLLYFPLPGPDPGPRWVVRPATNYLACSVLCSPPECPGNIYNVYQSNIFSRNNYICK